MANDLVDLSRVTDAYEALRKAHLRGRVGRKDRERILRNLRTFLEECGVYRPVLTVTIYEGWNGRADDGE